MDFNKVILYFNTIKYLKFKQIFYRLLYFFKKRKKLSSHNINISSAQIYFPYTLKGKKILYNDFFIFLNKKKKFNKIDWNFILYGKLWNYNLNYFDFLLQDNISKKEGMNLIFDFISKKDSLKFGNQQYPTSLRIINFIKFISKYKIKDFKIDRVIYDDIYFLKNNLEYHLLGNHLLENGFSLLFGSFYINDEVIKLKAISLIKEQLNEQILDDGAHFELSPMYHQIILIKILDCIQLLKYNNNENNDFLLFLAKISKKMLSWLQQMTYKNGYVPLFNDSSKDLVVKSKLIFQYAEKLDISWKLNRLSESGYRKIQDEKVEIYLDIGDIGPKYLPGHAHSDTFNFELNYKEKPIIVDTGISTYENNNVRIIERSNLSHNTISINNLNSSEVWSSFRVANRAKVNILDIKKNKIIASHNGYNKLGIVYTRKFELKKNKFIINDSVKSNKNHLIKSFLLFHPECKIRKIDNSIKVDNSIIIQFINIKQLRIKDYNFPRGFNLYRKSKKAIAIVEKESIIEITYL